MKGRSILAWMLAINLLYAIHTLPLDAAAQPAPVKKPPGPVLAKSLEGPMKDIQEIVFCTRGRYDDGHWYANIGYYCDDENKKAYPGNGKPDDGKLCRWNVRTGQLTVLLDAQGGSIRDPQVHYDARKILFSYRKAGTEAFHLYEIECDGSGLRQLTSGDYDDYEPVYLPDGHIAFVSTRCQRWVNCWMTQVGVMYRCDADGGNIELISANTEHDNTPWVMPDGRLIYTRWEYVDRSQVEFHSLWTVDPDGTAQSVFFGNMHPGIVMIDAKPIPGTDKIVASFSPGHGVNEHAGIATVVSPSGGPDAVPFARPLHGGALTRDPFAIAENCFIAARENEMVCMDGSGAIETIYRYPGPGQLHEPRPLTARPRERVIAPRTHAEQSVGRMIVADVYRGRNLPGVERGQIKKLLILESLPKQVNFSGGPDLVSWLGTFTLERVLGTVPVEADGSAFFEVPADRQVFFVALDENDLSVKRMQSWCSVRPGEVISCVGCHEQRVHTPENKNPQRLLATQRPASKIESFADYPDVLDYTRDIQPVLDRHCVSCHSDEKPEGKVILSGDLGPNWSHSYFSMFAHRLVADGRNGLGNQPPRTIGSSASRLLKLCDGSHYNAKVSDHERRTLWLWIESGAAYAGSYAGLRNEKQQQVAGGSAAYVFVSQAQLLQKRCKTCHESDPDGEAKPLPLTQEWGRKNRAKLNRPAGAFERLVGEHDPIARFSPNILLNFSRPECSPLLLGPLAKSAGGYESCGAVFKDKSDPDYQTLLKAISIAKSNIDAEPRYGSPDFRPNRQYLREMQRYGVLTENAGAPGDRLDFFALDQKYWSKFWYRPQ